jgi:hypothetical protein
MMSSSKAVQPGSPREIATFPCAMAARWRRLALWRVQEAVTSEPVRIRRRDRLLWRSWPRDSRPGRGFSWSTPTAINRYTFRMSDYINPQTSNTQLDPRNVAEPIEAVQDRTHTAAGAGDLCAQAAAPDPERFRVVLRDRQAFERAKHKYCNKI